MMTRTPATPVIERLPQQSALRMPRDLGGPGLLVGWSMEREHQRTPFGFSFGSPLTSPETGFVDPILLNREGHLLTVAPTGAGKGVGCIVPALLHYDGPAIVIDPKGENAAITAERRRALGQEVVILDPMGIVEGSKGTFNPLDLIDPRSASGVDEAAALVHALLPDGIDDGKNLYWVSRGRQLLLAMVLHVVTDLPREKQTLTEVRRLANAAAANPQALADAFAKSRHPEVRIIAGNLQIKADNTLGGILSFAQEGIDFMRGPALQAAVERTSFDLDGVVRGAPLTIYIVMPPHMLNSHGRFLRLWISALMTLIMRRRNRPDRSTLFILDEAAQLGPLDELRTAVTLMRGYGLQTWTFWQDLSQMRILYPTDWQTMLNNCAVLQAFGPNNLRAAEDVAAMLGALNGREFLALEADEMLLQIAGDEAVVAARPNYLRDPPFKGLFAENPFFRRDADPLPRPAIDRTYLRPMAGSEPKPRKRRHGPGPVDPIDRLLAREILREVGGDAR
jgi:type IV secretion system protein VirD4